MPILPFKLNQDRRHHIPRQQHKVTNWPAYDASLRQRGSLTVWFTDEAIAAWAAEPRTTRGGQPWYSSLAILTALTIRAVFRLAYRQAEGLLGSIVGLLGLGLRVPDHTTLSRRAATLEVPRPGNAGAGADSEPMHLLVDSTGLKLCGAGEWLLEKHGTKTRRSWRKLHLGVDADTGQIHASLLTNHNSDDGAQVGPLLDQVKGPLASFTGDGAYDQDNVTAAIAERYPDATIIVPPRSSAVLSNMAETAPTQRDRHLQHITEHGRTAWQKAVGYNLRPRRDGHVALQAGHRQRAALAHGRAPRDGGERCCSCAELHAWPGPPELRSHRLNPDMGWGQCARSVDRCNTAISVFGGHPRPAGGGKNGLICCHSSSAKPAE